MGVKGIGRFSLKPRQNGRNIVGCYMLWVASVCTPCCMLLRLVAQKCETVQTFRFVPTDATTPNIVGPLLRSFARSLSVLKPESITRATEMQIKRRYSFKKKKTQ